MFTQQQNSTTPDHQANKNRHFEDFENFASVYFFLAIFFGEDCLHPTTRQCDIIPLPQMTQILQISPYPLASYTLPSVLLQLS